MGRSSETLAQFRYRYPYRCRYRIFNFLVGNGNDNGKGNKRSFSPSMTLFAGHDRGMNHARLIHAYGIKSKGYNVLKNVLPCGGTTFFEHKHDQEHRR
jgi:hypothetical protein